MIMINHYYYRHLHKKRLV